MKSLTAMLMLGAALSMPAAANIFDGMSFSIQERGFGGKGGGREGRPVRDVRPAPPVPQPRERPRGQMTEEERRQLHRDLDKAQRELYRDRRP